MALGYCRLSREAFFAMTPREFSIRMRAEVERENREFERLAQVACWVMNPWLKPQDRLSVRKLLRPKQRARD